MHCRKWDCKNLEGKVFELFNHRKPEVFLEELQTFSWQLLCFGAREWRFSKAFQMIVMHNEELVNDNTNQWFPVYVLCKEHLRDLKKYYAWVPSRAIKLIFESRGALNCCYMKVTVINLSVSSGLESLNYSLITNIL